MKNIERKREMEGEGDDERRQARNLCLRNIGGCVEHLKHTAVARIGRLRIPYRVGHMRAAAYDIHQRRPATTIAGVLFSFSLARFFPLVTAAVSTRRHFAGFVRSALLVFSSRLFLSDLLCLLSFLSLLVPLILFHLPRFPICPGIFILLYFLSNLSFKHFLSHIFTLLVYFTLLIHSLFGLSGIFLV